MKPPVPQLDGPFQPGIVDPQWPLEPPEVLRDEEEQERYHFERAGRIDPQNFLTVVTADAMVSTRAALRDLLQNLSAFTRVQMTRTPDSNHIPILREMPKTWRVTITVGFG